VQVHGQRRVRGLLAQPQHVEYLPTYTTKTIREIRTYASTSCRDAHVQLAS
jgi:hypothetical protein